MVVLLLRVAQHSGIKGPVTFENLAREKRQRRETLHGNQEEGCEEEKETLSENALADPRVTGLSGEAPPVRLFRFGG
jgi:hypothetical protein